MQALLERAETLGALLKARGETLAIAESSTGGLVSAALLALPGASAYFFGGAVVYTRAARAGLLGITEEQMAGMRPSTEPYALLLARTARERLGASWGIGESGAAGPTGNRYGDAAGHCCLAVSGRVELVRTLETAGNDRQANMRAFGLAVLDLLAEAIQGA
jgi:PncC family amidohydrolase